MCPEGFLSKSTPTTWEFLEAARDDSLSSRLAREGMHVVFYVSHLDSKIVILENMLKDLSVQQSQIS